MNLQVLVASMYQKDFSLFEKMNIQTNVLIANQCDEDLFLEHSKGNIKIQMISTKTRGLSKNRNIAIKHADGDILLFADDDVIFNNDYEKIILTEFEKHPKAEAIKFNLHNLSSKRKIAMKQIDKFEKATRKNMSSSGVCGLAIKRDSLKKAGVNFDELFGTGTDNYCGEDTIFLQELIKKRIKLFRSPIDIAGIDQTESSWFEGYNEKYFTVAGKVFARIYPNLCYLLACRSAYRFYKSKNSVLKFVDIFKCYKNGIRFFKKNGK